VTIAEESPATVVPLETQPVVSPTKAPPSAYTSHRIRSISNAESIQSTDSLASTASIASTASSVPSKRQRDFEKLFGPQLRPFRETERPMDFLTVLQTQSADLQASVLLHGRLYLTAYHLCFRSNIVGYVTEKIYDLKDISAVERSTTAKWIQNAVSLTAVEQDSGEEVVVGYGSMGDREAMFEQLTEVWRNRAPEKYGSFQERKEKERVQAEKAKAEESEPRTSTSTIRPSATTRTSSSSTTSSVSKPNGNSGGRDRSESEVKHTKPSGEKYDELAIDTKIPIPMKQLFDLLYHNKDFHKDFLEVRQKLTDVDVSDWAEQDGRKERKMTYVMHMNNRIGPKKSDCNGSERIEVEDPEKAYEIVSETQTPDIPSGKSFKIRTRTCLSHTGAQNDTTPATRLYCTTQCDWSASSMLKSTITPAVIKGQKEYHVKLVDAVNDWIADHPDDFQTGSAAAGESEKAGKGEKSGGTVKTREKADRSETESSIEEKSIIDQLAEIPGNQAMVYITLALVLSLLLNFYLLSRGKKTVLIPGPAGVVPVKRAA